MTSQTLWRFAKNLGIVAAVFGAILATITLMLAVQSLLMNLLGANIGTVAAFGALLVAGAIYMTWKEKK